MIFSPQAVLLFTTITLVMPHHIQYAALVVLTQGRRIELSVPWDTGVWVQNEIAQHRLGPLIVIHGQDGERGARHGLFVSSRLTL